MALRTIRVQGDPVLEKICKPVKELTPRTKELIEDMLDTMYEANGVGLAAPQVTYLMHELKEKGLWFVCADMDGTTMYDLNLTGPIGLVIGNEGSGVSRLVKEKCDFVASIPMKGDIDSLNASVAAGVLAYEIVRQRLK